MVDEKADPSSVVRRPSSEALAILSALLDDPVLMHEVLFERRHKDATPGFHREMIERWWGGELRCADGGLVAAGLEHLDAGCRLRPSVGEKGNDVRRAQGCLRRAEGAGENADRRQPDQNNSVHGRALRSNPPPA